MNKTKLLISKGVSLPLDTVTQTIAILAKRRVGKSYTMRRLVEQLFKTNQQVVIVDPKGDQWGIRSSADGKAPGFPVVILGGEHGDAPLEANAGEVVANLVVKERVSVLLDISLFRKHEVATFMTGFMENLYRLKAQEQYRTPMMLVIDEADAIAPQKPQKGEERMLGAAEDIVRRGGQRGIGCTLVTQRSAVLNKNVLTQAQMLIVLRTIAPQDLAAMNAWIDVHGEAEQRKILMGSLPSLPIGDAWFWSPGWPTDEGIFERAHVLPIETFDSGATPKVGEKPIVPKNLADVDLEVLKAQMAATIEKTKKDNPKSLHAEIARLTHELAAAKSAQPKATTTEIKKIEVPVIGKRATAAITESVKKMAAVNNKMGKLINDFHEAQEKTNQSVAILLSKIEAIKKPIFVATNGIKKHEPVFIQSQSSSTESNEQVIDGPEQRILDAIAWFESLGNMQPEQAAVAFIAGYLAGGSGYERARGSLNKKGLTRCQNGSIGLTNEGRIYSQQPVAAPTTEQLHQKVLAILPGPEQRVIQVLLSRYPDPISNADLAAQSGYEPGGSGYERARGRLRTLGLIEFTNDKRVKAREILFI